jgi:hypothetical protein
MHHFAQCPLLYRATNFSNTSISSTSGSMPVKTPQVEPIELRRFPARYAVVDLGVCLVCKGRDF